MASEPVAGPSTAGPSNAGPSAADSSSDTPLAGLKRKQSASPDGRSPKRQALTPLSELSSDSDSEEYRRAVEAELIVVNADGDDQVVDHSATVSSSGAAPEAGPSTSSDPSVSAGTQLTDYSCPICYTPPTNATLTPCGHICCGSCLFSAIKIAAARNIGHEFTAKCPVCRATIPHWDGKGGGVIGLKPKVQYTL